MSDSGRSTLRADNEQDVSVQQVREQLKRLVASPSFRSSKRYPRFLTYIIEKELAGAFDELKERLIGIEVFDRVPDYDHTSDPCVRVAASEIRKRLAQYYIQSGCESELRIELPIGAYVPSYYWPVPTPQPPEETTPALRESPLDSPATADEKKEEQHIGRTRLLVTVLLVAVSLCAVSAMYFYRHRANRASALDEFWAPIIDSGNSTLICVGNIAFVPSSENGKIEMHYDTDKTFWDIWSTASRVGPNGVSAVGRVAAILGKHDRQFAVQVASMTTLSDLHAGPAVLIGDRNNPWTGKALSEERFQIQYASEPDTTEVVDTANPGRHGWNFQMRIPIKQISHAYAVVDRHFSDLTGQPVLAIAGLGPYGANAASEFVSNPQYFEEFARKAPNGWSHKNVEIVLETDVIDGRTGAPRVVAFDVR